MSRPSHSLVSFPSRLAHPCRFCRPCRSFVLTYHCQLQVYEPDETWDPDLLFAQVCCANGLYVYPAEREPSMFFVSSWGPQPVPCRTDSGLCGPWPHCSLGHGMLGFLILALRADPPPCPCVQVASDLHSEKDKGQEPLPADPALLGGPGQGEM